MSDDMENNEGTEEQAEEQVEGQADEVLEEIGEKLDFGEISETTQSQGQYSDHEENTEGFSDFLESSGDLRAVYNIPVQVSAILGTATLPVSQLLKLGRGAVIDLDRRVGESIDICVNNRLVARGEIVVVDERLGITMTEIIKGSALK